jgi:hypothetical protein
LYIGFNSNIEGYTDVVSNSKKRDKKHVSERRWLALFEKFSLEDKIETASL